MMPTDTLTCQVTPDSVEPTSLSCSVPPLEYLDMWTTIGSIATALFTLVLPVFAIAAWRSSMKTLGEMRTQTEEMKGQTEQEWNATTALLTQSSELNQRNIEHNQTQAMEDRQMVAMTAYVQAVYEVLANSNDIHADMRKTVSAMVAKGIVWRTLQDDARGRMKIFRGAENLLCATAIQSHDDHKRGFRAESHHIALVDLAEFLMSNAPAWQDNPERRTSLEVASLLHLKDFEATIPDIVESMTLSQVGTGKWKEKDGRQ